jgi:Domain of unknown function (DUF1707)
LRQDLDAAEQLRARHREASRLAESQACPGNGVINALKSAYVLGFVTKDEFDARVSQTLTARTNVELARITTDLPGSLVAAQPPPGRAPARATFRPVDRAAAGFALLAAIAFAAATVSADGWMGVGAPGSALVTLLLVAVGQITRIESRPSACATLAGPLGVKGGRSVVRIRP